MLIGSAISHVVQWMDDICHRSEELYKQKQLMANLGIADELPAAFQGYQEEDKEFNDILGELYSTMDGLGFDASKISFETIENETGEMNSLMQGFSLTEDQILEFTEIRENLLSLARAGELTAQSFEKIEGAGQI